MDGLLPAYPSLWLPFFFSFSFFVASVKCKSSHLTPPQTVSHSLPSHLINHAIELNATQQKKKKKKKKAFGRGSDVISPSSLSPPGAIATSRQVRLSRSAYFAAPIV